MIAIFSSNRTKILTKQVPEDVASDADGVEALPRPRASLLHCLHGRHEHNVKSCGVLATKSEVIFEPLINTDHCVSFIKTTCDFKAALAILIRWESWALRGSSQKIAFAPEALALPKGELVVLMVVMLVVLMVGVVLLLVVMN